MSGLKELLRGQLRKLAGVTSIVAVCLIAYVSLINQEDSEISNDSDFFQRNRVIQDVVINGVVPDMDVYYTIEADSLIQFPAKGHSDLVKPRVSQTDSKGFKRMLVADSGKYFEDNQEILLTGNVSITLTDADELQVMKSTTSKFTFQLGDLGN